MIFFLMILAYLLGSIPFGLLLVQASGHGDVRQVGSGNIGTSNVLRAAGKKIALATFILDASKGGIAFLLTYYFLKSQEISDLQMAWLPMLAGFFAVIGHNYPIWLKFKGGKGVATSFGLYLFAMPFIGLLTLLSWLFVAFYKKISSLSALVSLFCTSFFVVIFYIFDLFISHSLWTNDFSAILAFMVIPFFLWILTMIRHKENINRIKQGSEPYIQLFKKK